MVIHQFHQWCRKFYTDHRLPMKYSGMIGCSSFLLLAVSPPHIRWILINQWLLPFSFFPLCAARRPKVGSLFHHDSSGFSLEDGISYISLFWAEIANGFHGYLLPWRGQIAASLVDSVSSFNFFSTEFSRWQVVTPPSRWSIPFLSIRLAWFLPIYPNPYQLRYVPGKSVVNLAV